MNLNKSIQKEKKQRLLINKAKQVFRQEYTKIAGMTVFPEDMGMTEQQVLEWYKTHLKLEKIRTKHQN